MKRPSERAIILVVDDDAGILRAAERTLGREHQVIVTSSPAEAIEHVKTARLDVAIVDVIMPEMSGFDLMQQIVRIRPDMDVIVMTANPFEIDNNLVRAIREGAFYFLQKPFDRQVLLTLVGRCLELRRLRKQQEEHVANLERELRAAKVFQRSLLPPEENSIGGVSIAARYLACDELAGDLYDYVSVAEDALALLVADVSGHGTSAAMMTGIVKSAFHAAHVDGYDPVCVMRRIADSLRSFDASRFVTAFAARLDGDELTYASAGHNPAILFGQDTPPRWLSSTGILISSGIPDAEWEAATVPIEPGEQLLIYTDGIIEAQGRGGMYGRERIVECMSGTQARARGLIDALLDDLRAFTEQRPLTDDITLLLIERAEVKADACDPKPRAATVADDPA